MTTDRPSFRTTDKFKALKAWGMLSLPIKAQENSIALLSIYLSLGQRLGGQFNTVELRQVPLVASTKEFNRIFGTSQTWQETAKVFRFFRQIGLIERVRGHTYGQATVYLLKCPILRSISAQGPSYWSTEKPVRHLRLVS